MDVVIKKSIKILTFSAYMLILTTITDFIYSNK